MSNSTLTTYSGPWINWSHGLLSGSTITLSERSGGLLTAFIATFVTIVGAELWKILCYILHQIRSSRTPQDGKRPWELVRIEINIDQVSIISNRLYSKILQHLEVLLGFGLCRPGRGLAKQDYPSSELCHGRFSASATSSCSVLQQFSPPRFRRVLARSAYSDLIDVVLGPWI